MLFGETRSHCRVIVQMLKGEDLMSLHLAIWKTTLHNRCTIRKDCKCEEEARLAIVENILDNSSNISQLLGLVQITEKKLEEYLKTQKVHVPPSSGKDILVKTVLEILSSKEAIDSQEEPNKATKIIKSTSQQPRLNSKQESPNVCKMTKRKPLTIKENTRVSKGNTLPVITRDGNRKSKPHHETSKVKRRKSSEVKRKSKDIPSNNKKRKLLTNSNGMKPLMSRSKEPPSRDCTKNPLINSAYKNSASRKPNEPRKPSATGKVHSNWLNAAHDHKKRPKLCSRSKVTSKSRIPRKYYNEAGSRIGEQMDNETDLFHN